MTISVDFGGGLHPRNPYKAENLIVIDGFLKKEGVINCMIGFEDVPLDDSSVDYVTAFDFIEHVPRAIWKDGKLINPFINTMSEAWRILKPGGIFYSSTPFFPHPEAYQDPTHVNIITGNTWAYFAGVHLDLGQLYGFKGEFELVSQNARGPHLEWTFKAKKG